MIKRRGYIYFFLSVLSGLLLWFSWPDTGYTPLIFIAFVPLFFIQYYFHDEKIKRSKLKIFGWFFLAMLIWNIGTTWWVYMSTDVGSFFALGLNSLFMAVVWLMFHVTKKNFGSVISYASLFIYWIGFEYMHLNWEISWPWLTLGNVFATHPAWIQWYEFTGALGGTLWVLAANLFFYLVAKTLFNRGLLMKLRRINFAILFSLSIILIIAPMIFSLWLYSHHTDRGTPVNVVAVQPNIDPYNEKFKGTGNEQLSKLLRLASTQIDSATDFVIGPETALPDGIWENDLPQHEQVKMIEKFMKQYPHLTFIVGLSSYKAYDAGEKIPITARKFTDSEDFYDAFNTAMQINSDDSITLYHKSRLVPGVEKMPYPKIFGFLEKYSVALGGTSGSLGTQDERAVFVSRDGIKSAPAICYESIYGGFMSGYMRNGAQIIFIITNDGWWGNTPGYHQHMNYGRLRAIEFRKSIARSANTGFSCFINQRGDVYQQTNWWEDDVIKRTLFKNDILTFYARHGDYIGRMCSYATILLLAFLSFRIISRRKKSKSFS